MITDGTDVVEKFREMFEELLNKPILEKLVNNRVMSAKQQLNEPTMRKYKWLLRCLKTERS